MPYKARHSRVPRMLGGKGKAGPCTAAGVALNAPWGSRSNKAIHLPINNFLETQSAGFMSNS